VTATAPAPAGEPVGGGARRRGGALVAGFALVAAVVLGIAWTGRSMEGRRALVDCDAALARADVPEAILAARVAAEARCPGCTAPEEGLSRLERIAKDAEARGDDATAFAAWRAARAALLGAASFSTSSSIRAHVELEIARFAHRLEAASVAAGGSPTPAAAEDRLRAQLAASDVTHGPAFALVALGGLALVVAAARFVAAKRGGSAAADLGLAAAGVTVAAAGALLF
jgi:hypothetical protein